MTTTITDGADRAGLPEHEGGSMGQRDQPNKVVHRFSVDVNAQWDLVEKAQSGDIEAFGDLYRLCSPRIRRTLYSRCRDWHLAEDLCSETFRRALVALPAQRGILDKRKNGASVGGWLGLIAKNLLRDHWTLARTSREISLPAHDMPVQIVPDDSSDAMLADEYVKMLRILVNKALSTLSSRQRKILTYRYLEDRSIAGTAALIKTSPGSIRVEICRTLKRLAGIDELNELRRTAMDR